MIKAELRKAYKEKRAQLTRAEAEKRTDLILINFQQINLPFLSVVHAYIASEKLGETDPSALVRYLQFKNPGLTVLLPKIDTASGDMQHIHYSSEVELVANTFGIEEPAGGVIFAANKIDLVLVPLLAFDMRGHRVGYGRGYYDRFLSQCRPDALRVGISFFEPEERIHDINQFDIPLNYCVTPQQVFEF